MHIFCHFELQAMHRGCSKCSHMAGVWEHMHATCRRLYIKILSLVPLLFTPTQLSRYLSARYSGLPRPLMPLYLFFVFVSVCDIHSLYYKKSDAGTRFE